MFALGTRRTKGRTAAKARARNDRNEGVVEADNRIVFAVMAIGMIIGALLTAPAKPTEHANLSGEQQNTQTSAASR